jgi:RNA polymerase-binding transcription factor DksA
MDGLRVSLLKRLDSLEQEVRASVRSRRVARTSVELRGHSGIGCPIDEDTQWAVLQMKGQTAKRIREALRRMQAGDYGVCDDCGKPIEPQRLRVMPFAERCRSCQESADKCLGDRSKEQWPRR